ncbi:MAG: hypothetical protein FWF94_01850 [Oscillospiraceae bacterium]|nr:hypothetical protein [Oscillospiraceae bacterium]
MIIAAIMFSGGNGSPATELFGRNLYLVKGNSFDLIRTPSIVVGERVAPDALSAGDIVIFTDDDNRKLIGKIVEIVEITADGEGVPKQSDDNDNAEENANNTNNANENDDDKSTTEEDNVPARVFVINDETGEDYGVNEQNVISKAVRASRFFGIVINFASSPHGLLIIVIIPCVGIILSEVLKPVIRKIKYSKEVSTVKKQDEVPTFIPEVEDSVEFNSERSGKSAAALKAYKQMLKTTETGEINESPELFTKPEEIIEKPKQQEKKKPLSSAKLAEAIAAVNLKHEESLQDLNAAEKARRISKAMAETKINTQEENKA